MLAFRKAALATAGAALATGLIVTAGPVAPASAVDVDADVTLTAEEIAGDLSVDLSDTSLDPKDLQEFAEEVATELEGALSPEQLEELADQFQALLEEHLDPAVLIDMVEQGVDALERAGIPAGQVADPLIALFEGLANGELPELPELPEPQLPELPQIPAVSVAQLLDTLLTGLKDAGVPVTGSNVTDGIEAMQATGVSSETLATILGDITDPMVEAGMPADHLETAVTTLLDSLTQDGTTDQGDLGTELVDGLQSVTDRIGMRGAEANTWMDEAGANLDDSLNGGGNAVGGLLTMPITVS